MDFNSDELGLNARVRDGHPERKRFQLNWRSIYISSVRIWEPSLLEEPCLRTSNKNLQHLVKIGYQKYRYIFISVSVFVFSSDLVFVYESCTLFSKNPGARTRRRAKAGLFPNFIVVFTWSRKIPLNLHYWSVTLVLAKIGGTCNTLSP